MKNNIEPLKQQPDYTEDEALSQFFNSKASSNLAELSIDGIDNIHIATDADLLKLGQLYSEKDTENLALYPAIKKDGLYVFDLINYPAPGLEQLSDHLASAPFAELNGKAYYLSAAEQKLYVNDLSLLPMIYSFVLDVMVSFAMPRIYLNRKIISAYVKNIHNESLQKYNVIGNYLWGCTVVCTSNASTDNLKRWLKDAGYQDGNNFFVFKKGDVFEVVLTDEVQCEKVQEYAKSRDLIFVTI